jgi:hypothetical protein
VLKPEILQAPSVHGLSNIRHVPVASCGPVVCGWGSEEMQDYAREQIKASTGEDIERCRSGVGQCEQLGSLNITFE